MIKDVLNALEIIEKHNILNCDIGLNTIFCGEDNNFKILPLDIIHSQN